MNLYLYALCLSSLRSIKTSCIVLIASVILNHIFKKSFHLYYSDVISSLFFFFKLGQDFVFIVSYHITSSQSVHVDNHWPYSPVTDRNK